MNDARRAAKYSTDEIEAVFVRREELIDRDVLTEVEDEELNVLRETIAGYPTAVYPWEQESMDLVMRSAKLLKRHIREQTS